jgi:hypothetical protein
MKYKIIHLFVKLTNLFQSKIVTTKVNKKIFFLFFIIAVIAMELRTFTRFHWIIHDHVIHELYCQINIKERLQRCIGVSYVAYFMACIDFEFPPQLQSCISYSPNNALVKTLV